MKYQRKPKKMEEFRIDGRRVEAVCYALGGISLEGMGKAEGLKIDVLLKEGDCPEGKCLEERLCCRGDCQNTYLAIFLKGKETDTNHFGGTVCGWERICTCAYAEKMGLGTIEDIYNFLKEREFQVREERGVKTYMVDGEALFKVVSREHCSFAYPIKDEDGVKERLMNEKRSTIEAISENLSELSKIARPAREEDYLALGLKVVGGMVLEETRKEGEHVYIERRKTNVYMFRKKDNEE